MSHTRPSAVVLIFVNGSGLYRVEVASSLAACLALLDESDSFLRRFGFDRIIYCERYDRYSLACARAEQLRQLSHAELERLITAQNPDRRALTAEETLSLLPIRSTLPRLRRRRTPHAPPILPFSLPRRTGDG